MLAYAPMLLLLFATSAVAQVSAEPPPIDGPDLIAAPPDFPWDSITAQWVERRYIVEAIRFKARDETGVDWPGSDEVMVATIDAKESTVSDEIDDIDSGDTHDFDPAVSCIIGVRPGEVVLGKSSVCDEAGEPGPLLCRCASWRP